jgi:uncharacterized protein (DUF983 family)
MRGWRASLTPLARCVSCQENLNRPPDERAFISLVIVGYPAERATVPTHALYEKHLPTM